MEQSHFIRLKNAVFYGYHGNHHEERFLGGRFHIDVEMETDFREAAEHDDLHRTVNYEAVYNLMQDIVTNQSFKLIEALARRIALAVLDQFTEVRAVIVRVRKPGVPLKGVIDFVEVEVHEHR
ncbi:MAG: dihydroneopterin aldolase [Bacteroidota bacterium]|jgi:dihydroneopterin aldolase|nr:dihydroneopterin aldolase [Bacteroidota bacterium]